MIRRDLKATFIGDVGVGKSCLSYQMKHNEPLEDSKSTIGAAFLKIQIDNYNLNLWDTSGQERFDSLIPMYMRGSDIVICVYDITCPSSLVKVENDLKKYSMYDHGVNPNALWILVGNKLDVGEKRLITTEQGKEFANKYDIPFIEVSAQNGLNVTTLVEMIRLWLLNTFQTLESSKVVTDNSLLLHTSDKNTKTFFTCC